MMTSTAPPLIAQVVLYENERRWVGGGFSKKGLFPTERSPFSTGDGSLSFKTLEELDEITDNVLLGTGWTWQTGSEWQQLATDEQCDDDGWSYAIDFSAHQLENASATQGMAHFVRRRRLTRLKVFDASQLTGGINPNTTVCQNCDSEAVDSLSLTMLHALAAATLLQRDAHSTLTDAVALSLKAKLMEQLDIGDKPKPAWSTKVHSSARLQNFQHELSKFHQPNPIVKACFHPGTDQEEGIKERMELVSSRYFDKEERNAIAGIVIRQLDPECELHCGRDDCSDDTCDFFQLACPNKGCPQMVSRKHLEWHAETVCGYKVIECPKGCGDSFPRNQQGAHLANACGLRATQCPFVGVGCEAQVPARDRAQHVAQGTDGHLLLMARRLQEYQILTQDLGSRLERLERENAELRKLVVTKSNQKDVTHVEKQVKNVSKKLTALEKKCHAEFRSHTK